MASRDTSPNLQQSPEGNAFPNPQVAQSETGDVESILSSRMTDMASEDGKDHTAGSAVQSTSQPQSTQIPTGDASRPGTGVTGVSSQRGAWSQAPPSRRGYASPGSNQRGSMSASVSGSTAGRPPSSTSRTHVPSLTSHAFFRPMSSQRLQAQRGGSRPATIAQQGMSEDGSAEGGSSVARQSINSNQTARQGQATQDEGDGPPPPSRGTEMTELETAERVTANTSPTQGHYPAGSLSESVRPLQRNVNTKGLSLNVEKSYKNGGGLPTPSKSPRSFRSSFLLPTRGDAAPNSPNRSTQGREKLSSVASSPGLTPVDAPKEMQSQKLGSNYQYFTGNTIFFWGGRLQNTRHKPINIATGLLFIVPSVLFYVFSASWLWHNISPAIPIVYAYVFYICISSFIHASVSDPGVCPSSPNLHNQKLTLSDPSSESPSNASSRRERRPSPTRTPNERLDHDQICHLCDGSYGSSHKVLQNLQHLATTARPPLQSLRQLRRNPRSPLCLAKQLRWATELPLLLHIRYDFYTTRLVPVRSKSRSSARLHEPRTHLLWSFDISFSCSLRNGHLRSPRNTLSSCVNGVSSLPYGPWGDYEGIS